MQKPRSACPSGAFVLGLENREPLPCDEHGIPAFADSRVSSAAASSEPIMETFPPPEYTANLKVIPLSRWRLHDEKWA
ncbi:hypothetical protein [Noviherbaspirillum humi]|uniref:hypothetical protein n=1 Tax=Noviherbaspirillum humi TaxID=1688639 RepID=UPI001160A190|nr:hypothetical protein [Noviherbaspirillum humi]